MFKFFMPTYNPTGLDGTVGGAITSTQLSGYIGEILATVSSAPSGATTGAYQYRKIFVKNQYSTTSMETKIWLDAVEHSEQIAIGLASGNDTTSTPLTEPGIDSWATPTNWSEGLYVGTLTANSSTGIWIRQHLSGISVGDPYATFRVYVGGLIQ